jgi:hypothetical protein
MKTPKKCGRKTCRSRQATRMMRRGIKASQKVWPWLDRQWRRVLPRITHDLQELKSSDVWNTLQDHWKLYQKKHYARDDNQVEEFRNLRKIVRQVTKMTGK